MCPYSDVPSFSVLIGTHVCVRVCCVLCELTIWQACESATTTKILNVSSTTGSILLPFATRPPPGHLTPNAVSHPVNVETATRGLRLYLEGICVSAAALWPGWQCSAFSLGVHLSSSPSQGQHS